MNEIKSLLWHLDNHTAEGQRLPLVHALARRLEATLEVLYAVTPLPMQFPFAMTAESGAAGQLAACEAEQRRAARAAFERACQAAACTGLHWQATTAGADAAEPALRYLQRHGVAAQSQRQHGRAPRELGEALLSQAADLQADLLVMGCYGHGRAREWALGGVTRTVLQAMTLSVLMAH